MFLESIPDQPDYSQSTAEASSPYYINAAANCKFEFWYYMAGDSGSLMPVLVHFDTEVLFRFQGNSCYVSLTFQFKKDKRNGPPKRS